MWSRINLIPGLNTQMVNESPIPSLVEVLIEQHIDVHKISYNMTVWAHHCYPSSLRSARSPTTSAASLPSIHVTLRCPHPLLPFHHPSSSSGGEAWGNPKAEVVNECTFWRTSPGGQPPQRPHSTTDSPRRSPQNNLQASLGVAPAVEEMALDKFRAESTPFFPPVLRPRWSPHLSSCGPFDRPDSSAAFFSFCRSTEELLLLTRGLLIKDCWGGNQN